MSTEEKEFNVIEIRGCVNGFVITAWSNCYTTDHTPRGYESHVVETCDPDRVGQAVADILRNGQMQRGVFIQPARKLP